jgi:putative oxidoreductase
MAKDVGLLMLRLVGVGLAIGHGFGKVSSLAAGQGERLVETVGKLGFPAPGFFAWAAALAEFAGGICVALGLGTRVAAGFAAFTMAVAAFGRHHAFQQFLGLVGIARPSDETLKAWGNPESALVYLAAFLAVTLLGPGRLSVDALLGRKS